jgi:hypothetical protein
VPAAARAGPKMLLEGLGDEGPEEPTLLKASQPNASPEVLGHASVQVHQGLGTRVAGGRGVAARCHGRSSQFPVARAFLRGYPPFLRCRAIVPGRVECPRGRVGRRIAVEKPTSPPCAFGQASSEATPRIPVMCENQQENSPADRHSKPMSTCAPSFGKGTRPCACRRWHGSATKRRCSDSRCAASPTPCCRGRRGTARCFSGSFGWCDAPEHRRGSCLAAAPPRQVRPQVEGLASAT